MQDHGEITHTAADTLHAAGDTLRAALESAAEHGTEHGGNLFTELLHHVQDSRELETPFGHIELPQFAPYQIAGITVDMSITKHVVFLWVAAAILCIGSIAIAWRNSRRPVPTGVGNLLEAIVVFVRDDIVLPNMGPSGVKYLPYLLTTFFSSSS